MDKSEALRDVDVFFKKALNDGYARLEALGVKHTHDKWDPYDNMFKAMFLARDEAIDNILDNESKEIKIAILEVKLEIEKVQRTIDELKNISDKAKIICRLTEDF